MNSCRGFRSVSVRRPATWLHGALIVLLTLATGTFAEVWTGTAAIVFDATSTLRDFSGTAPVAPFSVSVVPAGKFVALGGTATVAVAEMDTRHAKRDENLRKMFEAERYPLVIGTVSPIQIDLDSPPAVLPIQLAVRDRVRTVAATLTQWQRQDGAIRFELAMTLSLRECGLDPPVLLGFIRVGDAVAVRVRVALARGPAAAPP